LDPAIIFCFVSLAINDTDGNGVQYQLVLTIINENCCHQTPRAVFRGPTSKRSGEEGRVREGRAEERREEREGREGVHPLS